MLHYCICKYALLWQDPGIDGAFPVMEYFPRVTDNFIFKWLEEQYKLLYNL